MKGPRHWRSLDLPGRFTWVQPFLMCLCMSTKTLIKNVSRVFQPALPNFRKVDGFALTQSVIQHAIWLALRPNNINNKNKDKNLKGGLIMCWCFQALRQWSEKDWGRVWGGWIRREVQQESKETNKQHAEGLHLLQLAITQEGCRTRDDTKENKDNKKCQELLIVPITSP